MQRLDANHAIERIASPPCLPKHMAYKPARYTMLEICWRLIRPGLLLTVLFSMGVAALISEPLAVSHLFPRLVPALLGTALLIAGASAMNQLLERRWDAKMARTASRPLPSGRATTRQVAAFAVFSSLMGLADLAVFAPPAVTLLAALSWCIYVPIYTPLKRVSVWHMPVGAVAGAIPVLLGAATAGAVFSPISLALFGVVFFWQFPHTAAIGWIYREQYARGSVKVAAMVDPSGRLSGRLALLGTVGLLATSLVPATLPAVGWSYLPIALLLGLVLMAFAAKFHRHPTDVNARTLWRMSLLYLPVLLMSLPLAMR